MEQEKSTSLSDQFKKQKTKSGLTPEQEKMMGIGEHLSPEEKALAERNRARMAELKKQREEEGTVMGGIKKALKDWYAFNLGEGPERRGSSAK